LAFLRFSRDKRGIESFALVHATTNRRGKVRPRVLYLFRTPPDIKVGREPFDPELRRALEKQYPEIAFDWRAIVETPIPSADADKWRERRRAERAAKHAAAEEAAAEALSAEADSSDGDVAASAEETLPGTSAETGDAAPSQDAAAQGQVAAAGDANRKRRRRRRSGGGGGNRSGSTSGAPPPPAPVSEPSGE
jgi:hypothetical protein